MPNLYCTLDEYSAYSRVGGASRANSVATLRSHQRTALIKAIRAASQRIDTWCGRHFYPLRATYYYDFLDAKEIDLGDHDLVELLTANTANETATVTLSDIYLYTGDDHNFEVADRIVVEATSGEVFYVGTSWQRANSLVGKWTYHERWSQAWLDSLDTVKTQLNSVSTSLEVNDADAVNGEGISPRFQVGQMLQIDDEWMYVADVNTADDILAVARAQNGTTAAVHAVATAISVYQPMADVVEACQIITRFLRTLPEVGATGKMTTLQGSGNVDISIPITAQQLLEPYRRIPVGAATHAKSRIDPINLPPIGGNYRK